MAIGYTPSVTITGDHEALINQRLIDWEHIDAAGIESDRLSLTIDTRGLDGLPRDGAKLRLHCGYEETGMADKGEFIISQTTPKLFPHQLLIVATAAPFVPSDPTGFKARRSASYGPTTLGALFRELTQRHGFSPRVAGDLDAIAIEHVDQTDETDMGFLTRLARKYDAVTKPYDGLYVMARRGQTKTLSGKTLPEMVLSVPADNRPGERSFMEASVERNARVKFRGAKAKWWDGELGKEVIVETGSEPYKTMRQRHQSESEARAAGEGEVRRLKRQSARLRIEAPGNPAFAAEGIIRLDDTWPTYMRGRWSLDKVTASSSRAQGYRCVLEATWPDGKED